MKDEPTPKSLLTILKKLIEVVLNANIDDYL